eukprot:GHVR01170633.1.p1 GENE.GHVR01170633.1~~GHVR01170633.1.p1  ORF type:complete len:228 (+),score=62.88 GHVR01170633.1:272-955(+)
MIDFQSLLFDDSMNAHLSGFMYADRSSDGSNNINGSPKYFPPERAESLLQYYSGDAHSERHTHKADVYSVGMMLYHLCFSKELYPIDEDKIDFSELKKKYKNIKTEKDAQDVAYAEVAKSFNIEDADFSSTSDACEFSSLKEKKIDTKIFLKHLLSFSPKDRPTAKAALFEYFEVEDINDIDMSSPHMSFFVKIVIIMCLCVCVLCLFLFLYCYCCKRKPKQFVSYM